VGSRLRKTREFMESTIDSAKVRSGKALSAIKQHVPTERLRGFKQGALDVGSSAAGMVKELLEEIVESKAFRDGAKGAMVGAVAAVPLPVIGPLFGGVFGAAVAMYFGQKSSGSSSEVVEVPAKGSETYVLLRELDDLRKRKILTRKQFEEAVRQVLDAWSSTADVQASGSQIAAARPDERR
jgi:hypothetical protein